MDDIKPQEPQPQQQPQPSTLSRVLNVFAYPAAAISGYFAFETWTRSSFYSNFAKRKKFEDLQKPISEDALGDALCQAMKRR